MADTGHQLSQIGTQGWRKENASRKAAKIICSTTRGPLNIAPCAACHGFLDVIRALTAQLTPAYHEIYKTSIENLLNIHEYQTPGCCIFLA